MMLTVLTLANTWPQEISFVLYLKLKQAHIILCLKAQNNY